MIRNASELRAAGRAKLTGHWAEAAMLTFVYAVVTGIIGAGTGALYSVLFEGLSPILSLLLLPMAWGYTMTFLVNHRGEDNDPFDIGHLFDGYRDFQRIFCTILLQNIYIFLWTLLLIVPGIVKAMSYALTPYILRDRPELKNNGAIELSMAMMQGHKLQLFWLYLTFIGWGILCLFTLGIGFFWLQPYTVASITAFYEDVKGDFENGGQAEQPKDYATDNYQK